MVEKLDWSYWINLAEVRLETAVCLSMGCDPTILDESADSYVQADHLLKLQVFKIEFSRRLTIAESHINGGSLAARRSDGGFGRNWLLNLASFRRWGESLPAPFDFPKEFPKPAPFVAPPQISAATSSSGSKPLNSKREKTLLRIIRALDALAELPERGAAQQVAAKLQGLGFRSPNDDAIHGVIKQARSLEPD